MPAQDPHRRVLVWDLPLRAFHWLLVICLGVSWASAEAGFDWTQVHFISGYCALGLILFRVVWGFVGPRHARFGQFLASPKTAIKGLTQLPRKHYQPSPGHNPLGSYSVLLMLLLVGVQAGTGLFISDDIFYAGPYNPIVSSDLAGQLAQIHHINFTLLQIAVALHVLVIAWYFLRKRVNLITPMLSGFKYDVRAEDGIANSRLWRALIIASLVAGAITLLVQLAPEPAIADYF